MILTTDAGSQVAPNWIAENLAAFQDGARRSPDKSILMVKASSYQRRFIGAVSLRTRTRDCSRSRRGCLTPLSTILGHTAPPSQVRALGDSYGLLPRWAAAPCPLRRTQSADCLAFASGRENSLLPHGPRDHIRSNRWARAGRCRRHLAIRSREPDAFCDATLEPFHTAFARLMARGCDACMTQDALLWMKTGRSLASWPATSMVLGKNALSALHGMSSYLLGDC